MATDLDRSDTAEKANTAARVRHLDVLLIAGPIMLSNATTPLVGYADTVVVGRLGSETLIGAVAMSANVFNYVYWIFGFLRMGTTGFTAQAVGAGDPQQIAAHLSRALAIALSLGSVLVILQAAIAAFAFWAMGASDAVNEAASTYFTIRIWGAPAALANFALVGWFIGLGRADVAFILQLILNMTNIALAILFVLYAGLGVAGAGLAILVAEIVAVAIGLIIANRELRNRGVWFDRRSVTDLARLKQTLAVNRDIMIRTGCLLFAFAFFTSQGARAGDLTLAVNAILFSIAMICTYLLDGFAFAAETLVGRSVGARSKSEFTAAMRVTTLWAAIVALILSLATYVAGGWMIDFATTNENVRENARIYLLWAATLPIVGVWCFQLDGIFIGATQSVEMRNMMILSLIAYLAAAAVLVPALGNHGLWLALFVFFIVRAVALYARLPVISHRLFPESS